MYGLYGLHHHLPKDNTCKWTNQEKNLLPFPSLSPFPQTKAATSMTSTGTFTCQLQSRQHEQQYQHKRDNTSPLHSLRSPPFHQSSTTIQPVLAFSKISLPLIQLYVFIHIQSQDHSIIRLGRDLRRSPSPTACSEAPNKKRYSIIFASIPA